MSELILPGGEVLLFDEQDQTLATKYPWRTDKDGYAFFQPPRGDRSRFLLHRLILGLKPHQIADHINGVRLDCRRSNLRATDRLGNGKNVSRHRDNKSGFKGVVFCKSTGRWRSRLMSGGKMVELGRFDDLVLAAKAYDQAAQLHHGVFARLNFPEVNHAQF